MKILIPLALVATLSACNTGFVDSDVERGLAGAALGYGAARALDGNGDRGALIGAVAGVFCDDLGGCVRSR